MPPDAVPAFLAQLAALTTAAAARLAATWQAPAEPPDQLLDVDAAAALLATTPDYLRRHGRRMGLAVVLSPGQIRYSRRAIERFITAKTAQDASA